MPTILFRGYMWTDHKRICVVWNVCRHSVSHVVNTLSFRLYMSHFPTGLVSSKKKIVAMTFAPTYIFHLRYHWNDGIVLPLFKISLLSDSFLFDKKKFLLTMWLNLNYYYTLQLQFPFSHNTNIILCLHIHTRYWNDRIESKDIPITGHEGP